MKFIAAWSEVASENRLLKIGLGVFIVVTIALAFSLSRTALAPPLIVERGCASAVANLASDAHTPQEMEAFSYEALFQRFDAKASFNPNYFSPQELVASGSEKKALESKKLTQRLVVNALTVQKNEVRVDADRVLSAGSVRSAMPLKVTLSIAATSRTPLNPYGLVLVKITEDKPQEAPK